MVLDGDRWAGSKHAQRSTMMTTIRIKFSWKAEYFHSFVTLARKCLVELNTNNTKAKSLLTVLDARRDGYHGNKQTQATIDAKQDLIKITAIHACVKDSHHNQSSNRDRIQYESDKS